jgi:hypothetical protein
MTPPDTVAGHTAGIDWSAPIEAVHDDGQIRPAQKLGRDTDGDYRVEYGDGPMYVTKYGGVYGLDWTIRNVAKATAARQSGEDA